MTPDFAFPDFADKAFRDAERSANGGTSLMAFARREATEPINLCLGELAHLAQLAVLPRKPVFLRRIEHVVPVGGDEEVFGIHAERCVAAMANIHALRHRPDDKPVHDAMGESVKDAPVGPSDSAAIASLWVRVGDLGSLPKPAAGFSDIDSPHHPFVVGQLHNGPPPFDLASLYTVGGGM